MVREIVKYGDPILRQEGEPVENFDDELRLYLDDLLQTMRHARGVGLASQQIGEARLIAVVDITGIEDRPSKMWIDDTPVDPEDYMPLALINPRIKGTKKKEEGVEGCLSFPGIVADITRSQRVRVQTRTAEGDTFEFDAAGLLGRAIQHEVDHLQGKLFIDLMNPAVRADFKDAFEAIKQGLPLPERYREDK